MQLKFTILTGVAAPYLESNVSTNIISVQKAHVASGAEAEITSKDLFAGLRFDKEGNEIEKFILNKPVFRNAKFLISGTNFGCGSSRDAAVHAITAFGIRCVIATSFGDIFFNNCFKNGVLPIVLNETDIISIAKEAEGGGSFEASLVKNKLYSPSGLQFAIDIPEFRRQQLLQGIDEIDLMLNEERAIATFFAERKLARPWI